MRDKAAAEADEAHQQAVYQHRQALSRLVSDLCARMMHDAAAEGFQQASIQGFVAQLAALPRDPFRQPLPDEET
jgi:hypothetical protein